MERRWLFLARIYEFTDRLTRRGGWRSASRRLAR